MFTSPICEGVDGVFVMCLQKSIPLETPTWVEVGPQAKVRVTLFDVSGSLLDDGVLAALTFPVRLPSAP